MQRSKSVDQELIMPCDEAVIWLTKAVTAPIVPTDPLIPEQSLARVRRRRRRESDLKITPDSGNNNAVALLGGAVICGIHLEDHHIIFGGLVCDAMSLGVE